MPHESVASDDVAELVRRWAEASAAYVRGDIERYVALARHAADYTLMPPNGGPTLHGFDASPDALAAHARLFRNGEAELEVARAHVTPDMVVLALVERQRSEVGGLPMQDCSLRVTLVFRRDGAEWRLVHRHADPLVRKMGPERTAAIARGDEV